MKNCPDCGAAFDGAFSLCPDCGKALPLLNGHVNYYDDVIPEDGGKRNTQRAGNGSAAKIALTVFGVILAIAACVAVLSLL